MFSGHGDPGHEFSDVVGGVTIGKPGERFGQPLVRVDGVELAALDDCGDDGPVVAAFVGAGEERILAIQCEGSD